MKPPTPNRWDQIVAQVIREHPEGISFRELQRATSTFTDELAALTRDSRRRRHRAARRAAIPADQEKAAACAPMGANQDVFRPA